MPAAAGSTTWPATSSKTRRSYELLASLPGLFNSQTAPAYNPTDNTFYSGGSGSATVNVVSRATGGLLSTFALDLGGGRNNSYNAIGYDENENWIIIADSNQDQLHVFDTGGVFLGSSNIDIDASGPWGFGYTNGQAFVYDGAREGWQGYDIGAMPAPATAALLALAGVFGRRRRRG